MPNDNNLAKIAHKKIDGGTSAKEQSLCAIELKYTPVVQKSVDYIENNKTERITLEDLEEITACSRYYIIRIFRSETGVTPHVFIMQRRLDEARKMLARGEPAAEVAAELGFVDQSHLIRRFKDRFGATPYSFMRSEGASGAPDGESTGEVQGRA